MRILVVEDEPKLRDVLSRALEGEGYAVDTAGNGTDAIWHALEWDYDAVVLDVQIPSPDGLEVARTLRQHGRWCPILFLTVRDAVEDRVDGLDAGGDDYLTKPFALDELFARLRALFRRPAESRAPVLSIKGIELDPARHTVTASGIPVFLSPKEFALLEYFMRHPGESLTRSQIREHVWDFAYDGTSNVVDVYVGYLRSKLGDDLIGTVRGVGYRLEDGSGQ